MFNRRKRKKARRRVFAVILLVLLLLYALNYSSTKMIAEEYTVTLAGLPEDFEGFRIAQLSDIHGNSFGEDNAELLSILLAQRPDMITITGDLTDDDHPPQTVRRLLEQLTAIAPVYYVTGNHEWSARQIDELMSIFAETGVTPLRNEYVCLSSGEDRLILAGIDDKNGYADMKTPAELMAEILSEQGGAPVILLSHRPDEVKSYWAMGYDLVLAGHYHGGIVQIPGVGGLISPSREFFPEYSKGLYTGDSGGAMVLSAGLAGDLLPPRLFNPLHLPIIILKGAA